MTARTSARDVACPTCGIDAGLPCRSTTTGRSNTDTHKARHEAARAAQQPLAGPTYAELCAGYGGLGMGAQAVLGGSLLWYAEWDDAPSAIMAHHHPGAHNYRDVTAIDWHAVPRVDVVTAGFPCQPFSHAGKRLGANDERHLWPYIAEGVAILRPQLVLLENVRGLMSGQGEPDTDEIVELDDRIAHIDRALAVIAARRRKAISEGATLHIRQHTDDGHRLMVERRAKVARARRARRGLARAVAAVLGGLADIGYDAQWYGFRAADVGAPHGRWRVFIFAWPAAAPDDPQWIGYGDSRTAAHGDRAGLQGQPDQTGAAPTGRHGHAFEGARGSAAELAIDDLTLLKTPTAQLAVNGGSQHPDKRKDGGHGPTLADEVEHLLPTPRASDGEKGGPNQRGSSGDLMLPSAVLFPTPVTSDREDARRRRRDGTPYGTHGHNGQTLTDATTLLADERLLPTPQTVDGATGHFETPASERRAEGHQVGLSHIGADVGQDWREYGPAIHRWESVTGRAAPAPTEIGAKGQPRLAPAFVEWMMGLPLGHVTDPAIGITRNEQLKALGNGVVWQQSAAATAALVQDMRDERAQRKAASA